LESCVEFLWPAALVAILFVTLGRVPAIYPVSLLFLASRLHISISHQRLMFRGGLRGTLGLALAQRHDDVAVASTFRRSRPDFALSRPRLPTLLLGRTP
jgi:hypothetical protein